MKTIALEEIKPSSYFTQPVYLDSKFVLSAPEMPFTAGMIKTLKEYGFNEVYSDGEPKENYVSKENQEGMENMSAYRSTMGDLEKVQKAERFYTSFTRYVESIFKQVSSKTPLNPRILAENVKSICDYIKEDRRFLMRASRHADTVRDEDYLVSHTVHSTVISIIIGTFLKLPSHRLIELGMSALLHETGMVKLPSEVYLSNRSLNDQEMKLLYSHPILAYNILKTSNFPLVVSVAALEHHERENGSGYPQHLTGDKIGLYAKIIAVACSFEALSSKRPHREAKDSYTSMLELLKNEGKQYNDTIIRALVYSLSIYPIGLYVMLSNGKKAQVIDVDIENPRYPVVQVFGELMPDGKNKIMQTSSNEINIVRPLTQEEIEN